MNQPAPDLSVQEAARAAEAEEVLLLDVREDDEWQAGHAPTAVHLPLGRLDASALPGGRPVATICRSGKRSSQAAATLAEAGVDVRSVDGGMNAWAEAGLPVLTDDGRPGEVV